MLQLLVISCCRAQSSGHDYPKFYSIIYPIQRLMFQILSKLLCWLYFPFEKYLDPFPAKIICWSAFVTRILLTFLCENYDCRRLFLRSGMGGFRIASIAPLPLLSSMPTHHCLSVLLAYEQWRSITNTSGSVFLSLAIPETPVANQWFRNLPRMWISEALWTVWVDSGVFL